MPTRSTSNQRRTPRRTSHRTSHWERPRHYEAPPAQWGRRLARRVGDKFGVNMSANLSRNEGDYRGQSIAIKCAKSTVPPVTLLLDMLDRVDGLWAVYLTAADGAEIWAVDIEDVRRHGYFTHGPNVQKRVELHRRKVMHIGELIGTLTPEEVADCDIP